MVPLHALWLPIVVSAAFVFLASWLMHMLLPIHRADFKRLPNEDQAMATLRTLDLPPGDYMVPCGGGPESMKDPAFLEKWKAGPALTMTVFRRGTMSMGAQLAQWFVYLLVVSVFAAYVSGRALDNGAQYLRVFRFAGVTAFSAYALALWQDSIWYKRSAATTVRYTFDGLVYALLTAGTFGWLWPK